MSWELGFDEELGPVLEFENNLGRLNGLKISVASYAEYCRNLKRQIFDDFTGDFGSDINGATLNAVDEGKVTTVICPSLFQISKEFFGLVKLNWGLGFRRRTWGPNDLNAERCGASIQRLSISAEMHFIRRYAYALLPEINSKYIPVSEKLRGAFCSGVALKACSIYVGPCFWVSQSAKCNGPCCTLPICFVETSAWVGGLHILSFTVFLVFRVLLSNLDDTELMNPSFPWKIV